MPGASAGGSSSYVTDDDTDVPVGLATDEAGLDDRDPERDANTPVGFATDFDGLGVLEREARGESERLRREPGLLVVFSAHAR